MVTKGYIMKKIAQLILIINFTSAAMGLEINNLRIFLKGKEITHRLKNLDEKSIEYLKESKHATFPTPKEAEKTLLENEQQWEIETQELKELDIKRLETGDLALIKERRIQYNNIDPTATDEQARKIMIRMCTDSYDQQIKESQERQKRHAEKLKILEQDNK
jgi:hypothetical protein